jgi:hypothetical protein
MLSAHQILAKLERHVPLLEEIQLEELRLPLEYSMERSGGGKGFEAEAQ